MRPASPFPPEEWEEMVLSSLARRFVRRFDAMLRRTHGVWEFTQDANCILRLGRGRCRRTVSLSDETVLHPGEPILEIHLWNEHLPSMLPGGPDVAWGVRFVRLWSYSLSLLGRYLQDNPAWDQVRAFRAVFAIADGDQRLMRERTLARLGFEMEEPEQTPWRAFADFWENLYNWALLWTYNPASLRVRRLLRLERLHLWMPRSRVAHGHE